MYTKYEANFLDTYKKFILIVNDEYENIKYPTRTYLKKVRDRFEETTSCIVDNNYSERNVSKNVLLTRELMMIASSIFNSVDNTPEEFRTTFDFRVLNSIRDLLTESLKKML